MRKEFEAKRERDRQEWEQKQIALETRKEKEGQEMGARKSGAEE